MSEAQKSLLAAFARGMIAVPDGARGFLIRAEPEPPLDRDWRQRLICEQTFKPWHDALAAAGAGVTRRLEGNFEFGLCLLTKHKAENFANIARAWELTAPDGLIVVAGAKTVGAATIERQVNATLSSTGLGAAEGYAKHHARVFWFKRVAAANPFAAWTENGELRPVEPTGVLSRPGIFSWDRVDAGSQLIAENLPQSMSGAVADLGAGWGYLSLGLLTRCPAIAQLDLYEAEWLALDAARANIDRAPRRAAIAYHWHDVAGEALERRYDWIVMNPPFHSGRASDAALGRAFIAAAAAGLRPGGKLLMVANRHLPYEAALKAHFTRWRTLNESAGFKVIEADR